MNIERSPGEPGSPFSTSNIGRLIFREFLSLAGSMVWAPALAFHGILFLLIFLLFETSAPNGMSSLLAEIKNHPDTAMVLDWLGWERVQNEHDFMRNLGSAFCRLGFALYLFAVALRLVLPERLTPGFRFKLICLVLLTLVEAALFAYVTQFIKLAPGNTRLEWILVCLVFCGGALGYSIGALLVSDLAIPSLIKRLAPDPGEPAAVTK